MELLNVESRNLAKITAGEACRGMSQYTHRYRSVTGSGLRPDTPKFWLKVIAKRSGANHLRLLIEIEAK